MKIERVINNNVAIAINELGRECVVIGKGIAFDKRAGDAIDATHAVKVYRSSGQGLAEKLSNIVEAIPFAHIKVCNEVVATARRELGEVDDKIFLTLIDHISFAIARHAQGLEFADTLWEMKRLYPAEYRVGLMALDIIEHRLGVRLPPSEAAFIAFHLLNANGTAMKTARASLKLIEGILAIVRAHFRLDLPEDSPRFVRFMTHLRFFAGRIQDTGGQMPELTRDSILLRRLLGDLPAESACVDEIAAYVHQTFHYTVSQDEKSYLMIHIHSILTETGAEA